MTCEAGFIARGETPGRAGLNKVANSFLPTPLHPPPRRGGILPILRKIECSFLLTQYSYTDSQQRKSINTPKGRGRAFTATHFLFYPIFFYYCQISFFCRFVARGGTPGRAGVVKGRALVSTNRKKQHTR